MVTGACRGEGGGGEGRSLALSSLWQQTNLLADYWRKALSLGLDIFPFWGVLGGVSGVWSVPGVRHGLCVSGVWVGRE